MYKKKSDIYKWKKRKNSKKNQYVWHGNNCMFQYSVLPTDETDRNG